MRRFSHRRSYAFIAALFAAADVIFSSLAML